MEIIERKPLVSIIIDTYNHGRFIEDAIESCLNQTFPQKDFEIIVVDDGSKDDTPERVKKYKDKIRYIYKENEGQASAFNLGFENSKGEYLVLLDGDDWCSSKRVERVVEEFERYKDVVCVLNARNIFDEVNKKIYYENFPEFHNLSLMKENLVPFIKSAYGTSRTSLRKSALKNILPVPEELKIEADLYINLSIIWFGNLSSLNERLSCYRIHGKNLFCLEEKDKLLLQINTMKIALQGVRKITKKSKFYEPYILNVLLKPYEIEIMDKEFLLNTFKKRARRKDFLKIEIEKFKFYKNEWNTLYRIYKILRMPILTLFSPQFLISLKNWYWKNKYFKIRNLIFPDA